MTSKDICMVSFEFTFDTKGVHTLNLLCSVLEVFAGDSDTIETIEVAVMAASGRKRFSRLECAWVNWRASEASETLPGVNKFELMRYVYIYVWRYVCHNSSACHVYVM